jgi:hypothetical protein
MRAGNTAGNQQWMYFLGQSLALGESEVDIVNRKSGNLF